MPDRAGAPPTGGARVADAPITAAEFALSMASVGPFETAPRLAVAVSGGADSLALALLAQEWARGKGGAIVALTVDHGLRREAAAEARQVGRWLAARGIAHHVLRRLSAFLRADREGALF